MQVWETVDKIKTISKDYSNAQLLRVDIQVAVVKYTHAGILVDARCQIKPLSFIQLDGVFFYLL